MAHLLNRLPEAEVPKDNTHACQDALLTIYNGHIAAEACEELGIQTSDKVPPPSTTVDLNQLGVKVVEECTIVTEAILRKPIEESGDGKYN